MNKQQIDLSPLLTPQEAGELLKVSLSWLAKARMRGDGPDDFRQPPPPHTKWLSAIRANNFEL